MRTLLPHPKLRDVTLRPSATAKVWLGTGLAHETVAVPGVALAAGDVLVAVELSTICDTDVAAVQGRRAVPAPLVLGHESVGRILALGDGGATAVGGGELHVGDRVVWAATAHCGVCDRCAGGLSQACRSLVEYGRERIGPRWELTGAFASHVHLRAGTAIVRVPETLPAAVLAPAACATATAWSAVTRGAAGRSLEGSRVSILGAGIVGLSAAAIAAERGATVRVHDPVDDRRALAARFGAEGSESIAAPADLVIDASGRSLAEAISAADVGATVVVVATAASPESPAVDAGDLARRLITVIGVHRCSPDELMATVGFLSGRGRAYPFADLIAAVHPLDAVDEALAAASGSADAKRVGLTPY